MAIPDGQLYSDGHLGAGTVATLEDSSVNTVVAGAPIKFGQAVSIANGQAVPATSGPIFGIALKRDYVDGDDFAPATLDNDQWGVGEAVPVLRDGTVSALISGDVDENDNATVGADGLFKTAGATDEVVGTFLSEGDAGGVADVQTRIKFASAQAAGGK